MITALIIYYTFTIALVVTEAWRITTTKNKNVSKIISVLLGSIAGFLTWLAANKPAILPFALLCIGIRLLFYTPLLNLARKLKLKYKSKTTNSLVDKMNISFILERLIGLVFILVSLLIYYV